MSKIMTPMYGRMLGDFEPAATYLHPWEVTVTDGMTTFFSASFQDTIPTFASREFAKSLGFKDRPVHPLMLLNLGLSFSVHDVSEQAIAHLAYLDVLFPEPCYIGDTLTASSKVLSVKQSSSGDRGVVHVRTVVQNQNNAIVCAFERLALIRVGNVYGRPVIPPCAFKQPEAADLPQVPFVLKEGRLRVKRDMRFPGAYEDLEVGDIYAHFNGHTVGDSEHMQLTTLLRNSHPLHFDEIYCEEKSFTKKRVVYGGLVLSWALALASRDVAGNAVWEMNLDKGAHPGPVMAGDTIYSASRVESKVEVGPDAGAVTFRVVGFKNLHPSQPLADGIDIFVPELGKKTGKIAEKVVEITRTLLVRKRNK
jgi:2-methylfumaryl-CoA hydratase